MLFCLILFILLLTKFLFYGYNSLLLNLLSRIWSGKTFIKRCLKFPKNSLRPNPPYPIQLYVFLNLAVYLLICSYNFRFSNTESTGYYDVFF